ncbi:C4-dicarboxylate ABC transporter permease [Oceanobacillus arenosus]|uniref:C4-dicarboxylate ABC transporter permease n=1 Tax=Oceanobacillus arenosus TaxID=1229153 RepID=A0A3D8PN46_9BACI|nr:TRAP transporter permease [Oceanobacillus arenosus]RDW17523.1 C4-dicarboxylate ABC transporter permease [Oceanobacillus arenosus]
MKKIILIVAVLMSMFHMYTAFFGVFPGMQQSAIHLFFALTLLYTMTWENNVGKKWWYHSYKIVLLVLAISSGLYIVIVDMFRTGSITSVSPMDMFFGLIMILIVLDATRVKMGWALPIIAGVGIIYTMVGPYLGGIFAHRGFSLEQMVQQFYLYTEGIYGTPLMIAGSYVIIFLILGAFLEVSGGGKFYIDLANSIFGRFRGGPAKIAVIASALFGSINGTAVANVVSTGNLTIPLMKKVGYPSHKAGAIESVASSGGQIMPPVMGASVFIMAQMIGRPYVEIMLAAAIPAILYFLAVYLNVDIESVKEQVKKIPRSETPRLMGVLKDGWIHFIPILVLLYFLMIQQSSPMRSAFWSIVAVFVVTVIRKKTRMSLKQIIKGLEDGAKSSVVVALATATAGIIIGVFNLTGLGSNLSRIIVQLSDGSLLVLLLLTMVSSIILGMGLPTVAAYLILAITVAPALIMMGLEPIVAHLFVFYFGILSAFTPPVAIAAYAASGIAKADPIKIAITACKYGLAGFVIPYLFVYSNGLLLIGSAWDIIFSVFVAIFAIFGLVVFTQGFFVKKVAWLFRIVAGLSTVLMAWPLVLLKLIGLGLLVAVFLIEWISNKKMQQVAFEKESISG